MRSLISPRPRPIRAELRDLNVYRLLERASAYRPGAEADVDALTKFTLRTLARRTSLEDEIAPRRHPRSTRRRHRPRAVARLGIGVETTSALLVAAGDNPERLRNEATFAHLCGVRLSTRAAANKNVTASTVVVTAKRTPRSGRS